MKIRFLLLKKLFRNYNAKPKNYAGSIEDTTSSDKIRYETDTKRFYREINHVSIDATRFHLRKKQKYSGSIFEVLKKLMMRRVFSCKK